MADTPAAGTTRAAGTPHGRHPVWFNIIRAGLEIATGLYCIVLQFNTTRDSIFGIMQAGTQIPAKMSAQQLLTFLNGNADKLNTVAFACALVVQVIFWWIALPATRNGHVSKLRKAAIVIMVGIEWASDAVFAGSTQTVLNGDLTRIFDLGGYAILGVLLFMLCVSVGSSFVFLNGIRVLGNVIEGTAD